MVLGNDPHVIDLQMLAETGGPVFTLFDRSKFGRPALRIQYRSGKNTACGLDDATARSQSFETSTLTRQQQRQAKGLPKGMSEEGTPSYISSGRCQRPVLGAKPSCVSLRGNENNS